MNDKNKLQEQLIRELSAARQRIADMERQLDQQRDTNETLRKNEERCRDLIENTSDWIWETDSQHRCFYTNARVKDILGYTPEEVLGKHPADFMTADEFNRLRPVFDELLATPRALYGLENQQLHKDGFIRFLEINIAPVFNADGYFTGFRGITRDITGRKLAEQALQRSEERFHLVSQAANDAMYDWDIASRTLWLSESHHALFGLRASQGNFEWWNTHIHPSDRARILSALSTAIEQRADVWMDEYKFLRADGRYIDILDRGQIIRNEKGLPVRIVGSMMDITAQKQAETDLRESKENYRSLIENSPIGIVVYSPDIRILMSNSRARLILGATEEQLSKRSASHPAVKFLQADGSPLPPEDYLVNRAIARNAPVNDLLYGVVRQANGEADWFLANAQPQWDKTGQLIRVIASFIDITARREAQDDLAQSEAKYRFLTENMNDIVWTLDMALNFTYLSPSIRRALDYTQEELLLGRTVGDVMMPESYAYAMDILKQELIRNQQVPIDPNRVITLETAFFHRDASIVWLENAVSFIRDRGGKIIGLYGVSRNITEQKRATKEREKLIDELKEALSEIRTLSGMLPICANCKKIRDDKGYWTQIESYISEHTEALFSHSICPDCAAKLYHDYLPQKK
jgi:PAS domain S-box-containing protein